MYAFFTYKSIFYPNYL